MNPTTIKTTTTTTTTTTADATNITTTFNNRDVEVGNVNMARAPIHVEQPSEAKIIMARNVRDENQPVELENTPFDPFPGVSRISSVTIGNFLGEGAFGQVYKGSWGEKPVALKKIDVNYAAGNLKITEEEVHESLQWEVSRLSTVSHPNLVQFYGIYEDPKDRCIYLVMEFCEGGTLQSKLEKENVPYSVRWQWALELAEGLAYLHDQGILHRDLKAENVLLDKNGRAKLADLGVAQVDVLVQSTEAHVVAKGMHDLHFIAPENFAVEGQPDNRRISTKATDIYALGLVFWQIANKGAIPRKESELSLEERTYLYNWQQKKREWIPDDCPNAFKGLIIACWRAPSERPSAQDLISRLEELGGEFNPQHHVLIKACNRLEKIIHPKRKEGLAYIAPFITAHQVEEPIENYWHNWETSKESTDGSNPPLKLEDTFLKFIETPGCSTLLLLGEAGLGKTLTTYQWADQLIQQWWAYIKDPSVGPPSYLPIFIRPTLSNWTHTKLDGAFLKIVKQYGLEDIPVLVFVDGYDELQMNKETPDNLVKHLGLSGYSNAKLIVTCRPNTVKPESLYGCLNFNSELQVYHFLPFSINQLLKYLNEQLSWGKETEAKYREALQNSKSVREVLRNPFVLYLLKQSWKTLSEEPLDKLSRWKIYEGFVKHSITTHSFLLAPQLQNTLAAGYLNLMDSFQAFARDIAFIAYQNNSITFDWQEALSKLNYPWVNLKELVGEDARKQFANRQEELNKTSGKEKIQKQRRFFLSEEDFVLMMQRRWEQFENELPLKIRNDCYEFSHKSLFEYFIAKKLLQFCDKETCLILAEDLNSLMHRLVNSVFDFGTLLFLHESWEEEVEKHLRIDSMLKTCNEDKISKKALTNMTILLNSIGHVLKNKTADYTQALEYYFKALAISEKVLGKDHPNIAASYNHIGEILREQNKGEEALEYYFKSLAILAIDDRVLRKNYPNVGASYNNIGLILQNQGKYEEALEYHFKALAIREKVLGKDHPDVAASYNNIALLLEDQCKYEKALEYYFKALAIQEQVHGEDHPETATVYNNIGNVLDNQGKYEEALEYYFKALAIREKVLGKDHPDVAASYTGIGLVLDNQGKYEEALEYCFKALAIREKVLGKDHPGVADSYYNIGLVFDNQGKYEEALEYYFKALAIREKVLRKDHPNFGASYNNIGLILQNQGKYEEALEYHFKGLAIQEKVYGKDHPEVAAAYNNIAGVLCSQNKYEEALEYHFKALAIREKVLGKDHLAVAGSYNNIAGVLYSQNKYEEALKYCRMALIIREKKLGKNHPDTKFSISSVKLLEQYTFDDKHGQLFSSAPQNQNIRTKKQKRRCVIM